MNADNSVQHVVLSSFQTCIKYPKHKYKYQNLQLAQSYKITLVTSTSRLPITHHQVQPKYWSMDSGW